MQINIDGHTYTLIQSDKVKTLTITIVEDVNGNRVVINNKKIKK